MVQLLELFAGNRQLSKRGLLVIHSLLFLLPWCDGNIWPASELHRVCVRCQNFMVQSRVQLWRTCDFHKEYLDVERGQRVHENRGFIHYGNGNGPNVLDDFLPNIIVSGYIPCRSQCTLGLRLYMGCNHFPHSV